MVVKQRVIVIVFPFADKNTKKILVMISGTCCFVSVSLLMVDKGHLKKFSISLCFYKVISIEVLSV